MAIPDKILNKPGKLEVEEMTIMKEHAYHGYQIVKKIPFLADVAEIVYSHQEWFNGEGYPRGISKAMRFLSGPASFPLPIPLMRLLPTVLTVPPSRLPQRERRSQNLRDASLIRKS